MVPSNTGKAAGAAQEAVPAFVSELMAATPNVSSQPRTSRRRRTDGGDELPRPAPSAASVTKRAGVGAQARAGGRARKTVPRGAEFAICTYLARGYDDAETAERCRPEFDVTREQVGRYRRKHADEIAAVREQMHEAVTQVGIGVPEERVLRLNRVAADLETRMKKGDHRECALLVARYLDAFKFVAGESGGDAGRRLRAEVSHGELARQRQEYAQTDERYRAAFRAVARAAAELSGLGRANRPADRAGD